MLCITLAMYNTCITSIKRSIAHTCDTSFLAMFHTRYVRWILSIHLTPPYGLILPSCAWTALNKLGNQEDSPSPTGSLIRGANLAFSPRYSPFHLCHRNFNLLIWQPLFPPRTKSNQGFFPAYARIFSFF